MKTLRFTLFSLIVFAGSWLVSSDDLSRIGLEPLLKACHDRDLECLKKSTGLFLKWTHKGHPKFNMLPIDPQNIPSLDADFSKSGLALEIGNMTVKGLRDQDIHQFKMEVSDGTVKLTTAAKLSVDGDVRAARNKKHHSGGRFSSSGDVLGTALYNYTLQKDNKGIDHFVIGPETISSELVGTPTIMFSPNLASALFKNHNSPKEIEEQWKEYFRKIAEKAYVPVIHNIRSAANIFPASAFFKNLHEIKAFESHGDRHH
ncbi:juvenile hormone-binding protein-like [Leguminivora glycinivorella]|uniref:juvenile hormone-binding protein-like n=1 Tax=Leguminivora glycinivorella TaxID=1035111 RepID=UPI00200BFBAF|nr:juvenile hormone-binding protein-like [Leguminivora glycinivorella]